MEERILLLLLLISRHTSLRCSTIIREACLQIGGKKISIYFCYSAQKRIPKFRTHITLLLGWLCKRSTSLNSLFFFVSFGDDSKSVSRSVLLLPPYKACDCLRGYFIFLLLPRLLKKKKKIPPGPRASSSNINAAAAKSPQIELVPAEHEGGGDVQYNVLKDGTVAIFFLS